MGWLLLKYFWHFYNMFKRLQQKWNVSTKQFWIIFIVFGLTGTTTAYLTKAITGMLGMNDNTWWMWKACLRIGMLLIGYQVILLSFGFLFGQWKFFWKYEKKLLQKIRILKEDKVESQKAERKGQQSEKIKRIAILASGTGTNAENIISYFRNHTFINVSLIVCNKPGAGVLNIAKANQVSTLIIEKEKFFRGDGYVDELKQVGIDFIILAGFLWKVPQVLIVAYRNRIINIHPALLPKYGGKGMYGAKVHELVIAGSDKESGITIHYVDEEYDNGDKIFQAKCLVDANDTPDSLAKKIHALEYEHFPKVIEECLMKVHAE
jgi:formyltetrahydrofolate-dependent phosphoribosylglycinamide formyltransferase